MILFIEIFIFNLVTYYYVFKLIFSYEMRVFEKHILQLRLYYAIVVFQKNIFIKKYQ